MPMALEKGGGVKRKSSGPAVRVQTESLEVPVDALPASSKIFSLPDYSLLCVHSVCCLMSDNLSNLVLAGGILLSGYRSRVNVTIIFPSVALLLD